MSKGWRTYVKNVAPLRLCAFASKNPSYLKAPMPSSIRYLTSSFKRSLAITIFGLMWLLLPFIRPAHAQQPADLTQPLLEANRCGDGVSEVHFTLAATGDTFPHENIQAVGEVQGYDLLFDHVRPFLRAADLAYTNFDGAMVAGAGYTGYPQFNYNPALATALRAAGIGLVSTANNHILDRGPTGLDATLDVLDANNILHHGAVRSQSPERPPFLPITLTRGDAQITIGFIAATWGTNDIPDPFKQVNLLYASNRYGEQGSVREEILAAVRQAQAATDLVVVAAHWGFEYQSDPDASQREAAQQLAAAGADVILGAQSHTLQPVAWIAHNGRQTLVIYSLANFLASQGAFQAQHYSATSVIFYVGIARATDGTVRVTGYRYLPTMHIDADTRPAPIPSGSNAALISHVRTMMRDPDGLRQVAPSPPAAPMTVCPPLLLAEAPTTPITGDFAQHYLMLGPSAALTTLGLPLDVPVLELAGDCTTTLPVLYTERQRLELHDTLPWPYRITGSQLGTYSFTQRYPGRPIERRTDLDDPTAFGDSRFRAFYAQHGGLARFGYPISGALNEDHPETGVPTTVQYFERARFELAPMQPLDAPLQAQVRLGLLGRELRAAGGVAALCGLPMAPILGANAAPPTPTPGVRPSLIPGLTSDDLSLIGAAATQLAQVATPWIPYIAAFAFAMSLLALLGFAFNDWRTNRRRTNRRAYRHRRSAYERFARLPPADSNQPPPASPPPRQTAREEDDDDDLLKNLLDQ
ncbi:MAG: CapA family protein [Candidatus Viridilinea halotolerans]|uniref:CapA family protein n=1 Tax=Candidatus Viridilinea halotolerans TaxID=2491704 RepID=A0A426U2H3_9CHLR|nr:MAG: CapA family protein [Candidatus Viridilinea halotolerans]